jgi:uncharacterized protein (DUF1778 family)
MPPVNSRPLMEKRQRLDLRITAEQKRRLEHAASLRGETLTGLVLQGALREAEQVIRDHEVMTLSEQDSLAFAQALLDPPPPAPRLLEAIQRYKIEFGGQAQ